MVSRPTTATVVFVDLVRFTSLTDIHGDIIAADAAEMFAQTVRASLAEGCELLKLLGDGALVIAEEPVSGLRTAATVVERLHDESTGLDVRGGLHHGPVVWRNQDVFGSAVNLSARLAALAEPGTLMLTRSVATHGAELELDASPLGERVIRGLRAPVELFQINPCRHGDDWVTDPVCGMRLSGVESFAPAGRIGFCSVRCEVLFRAQPELYR